MMRRALPILVLLCLAAPAGAADIVDGLKPQRVEDVLLREPPGVTVSTWAQGLEAPWSLVFLPDRSALVSERPGRIRRIAADGAVAPVPYARLDAHAEGEGGLMGLALHPDFPRTPFIYAMLTQNAAGGGIVNRVVRLRHSDSGGAFDRVVLDGIPGARFHNGGRIAFGPDGMLYVGTGENFRAELAQDLTSLGGKILRVTQDGAVPPDNPFPGSPVWSYGHRNPQGLAWHPETRELFASEHGPSGEFGLQARDEVNFIAKGGNYGWPRVVCAGGQPGLIDPLVCWPAAAVPPSGIAFFRGALFVATLRSQALIRIGFTRDGGAWRAASIERWFAAGTQSGTYGRLRDVVVGPDDALYVLTSNRDGRGSPRAGDDRILRLVVPP